MPVNFSDERLMLLTARGYAADRRVIGRRRINFPDDKLKLAACSNTEDFLFRDRHEVPTRQKVMRVLDFGADYGRQFNLCCQDAASETYVAMDAVAQSYGVQHLYLPAFDRPVVDPGAAESRPGFSAFAITMAAFRQTAFRATRSPGPSD
jgi:hypothetical protein